MISQDNAIGNAIEKAYDTLHGGDLSSTEYAFAMQGLYASGALREKLAGASNPYKEEARWLYGLLNHCRAVLNQYAEVRIQE